MPDSNIKIKIDTAAELRGLRKTEEALQDQIATAKATGKAYDAPINHPQDASNDGRLRDVPLGRATAMTPERRKPRNRPKP